MDCRGHIGEKGGRQYISDEDHSETESESHDEIFNRTCEDHAL